MQVAEVTVEPGSLLLEVAPVPLHVVAAVRAVRGKAFREVLLDLPEPRPRYADELLEALVDHLERRLRHRLHLVHTAVDVSVLLQDDRLRLLEAFLRAVSKRLHFGGRVGQELLAHTLELLRRMLHPVVEQLLDSVALLLAVLLVLVQALADRLVIRRLDHPGLGDLLVQALLDIVDLLVDLFPLLIEAFVDLHLALLEHCVVDLVLLQLTDVFFMSGQDLLLPLILGLQGGVGLLQVLDLAVHCIEALIHLGREVVQVLGLQLVVTNVGPLHVEAVLPHDV
mmetsp:Transcript_68550/g.198929  ORF Transcript_68550/g.198929 Transcript_68550/m.198929 type:complete len:282 (-) Transcript_68550:694-1539(-)